MKKLGELALAAGAVMTLAACAGDPTSPLAARPMTPVAEGALAASPRTGTAPHDSVLQRSAEGTAMRAPAPRSQGAMASNVRTGTAPVQSAGVSGSTRGASLVGAGDSDFGDDTGREATKALNILVSRGHGAFSNFRRHGDDFVAHVRHQGSPMAVLVDPDTGTITALPGARGS
jgi:hypothetical protein